MRALFLSLALLNTLIYSCNENLFSLRQQRVKAKSILQTSISNDLLANIEIEFAEENEKISRWFNNHKQPLSNTLSTEISDVEIKIMGSQRWKTNHVLSDIDAVIVTNYHDHEKVVDILQNWYSMHYPTITPFRMKTKAGLSLFILKNFFDHNLGEIKLEYTVQDPETNQTIINEMMNRIKEKFKNKEEKARYALAMMEAVYKNDIQKQLQLKEWTRVLEAR